MSDFEKELVSEEQLKKLEEAVKYMEELEADA